MLLKILETLSQLTHFSESIVTTSIEFLKSGKTFGSLFYLLFLSWFCSGRQEAPFWKAREAARGTRLAPVARFSPPVSMCCFELTKPSMDLGKEGLLTGITARLGKGMLSGAPGSCFRRMLG